MPTTFVVTPNLPAAAVGDLTKQEFEAHIAAYRHKNEIFRLSDNGFIWTVFEAYNKHHNLVLRPDDVWLAIATQFSFFMRANAEELRPKFVDHEGKKDLEVVETATLSTADYGRLAELMAEQISKNIHDKELKNWIIPAFSTTQDVDRVVGAMVLMASAAEYFDFKFMLMCGLPRVTLEGELKDWQEIERRAGKLINYDVKSGGMAKWLKLLAPVLAQFTAAVNGKPDINFWQRVCSYHGNGSGPRYLSGWITVFSVFDEAGRWCGEQLSIPDYEKVYEDRPWPIINTNDIAIGKVKVDVLVNDNGVEHHCELVAGHMYMHRVDETSLQPGVHWFVRHKKK